MVSVTQAGLLQRLLAGDRTTEKRVARELGLTQGTVSQALKGLKKQGFLKDNQAWAGTPHALALKNCLAKNRVGLPKNREIEGGLAGKEVEDWPRLQDLTNMAETNDVKPPLAGK